MQRRRNPEVIAGRVAADGSITAGDGFTVQKTGTGVYVVTVQSVAFRLVAATVSPATQSILIGQVFPAMTDRSFTAQLTTTSGLSDSAFYFVAVGVQQ